MRYIIDDKRYNFRSAFDTETGAYIRTGILDENGNDTGVDPFMASYPHLIDVGIMGHCIHGKTGLCAKAGIGCYQSGMFVEQPNMSVEDFVDDCFEDGEMFINGSFSFDTKSVPKIVNLLGELANELSSYDSTEFSAEINAVPEGEDDYNFAAVSITVADGKAEAKYCRF